ncbi:MAG: hypothetical protein IJO56_02595 [Oscillospiraceae bacterium]|nr:hypothetical protein [Oscillospiraceae bacterium]
MELLKTVFPFSFQPKKDVAALVINILIYLAVGLVAGLLIGLLSKINVLGLIVSLVGGLADLYVTAGVVLSVLDYTKVIK